MLKFFSALFSFLNELLRMKREQDWKQQGRKEMAEAAENKVEENVRKAQDAVAVPDPVRSERLRRKYDRAKPE